MKLSIALVSCLALALGGCKKASDKTPAKGSGSATAGKPADPTPAPGSAAPTPGSAAPTPGSAAATAGATAPAAGELRVPAHVRKVGDKVTEVEDRKMVAKVAPKPDQVVEVVTIEAKEEIKEVIAVDGDLVTKVKISYPKVTITETANGKTKDKPTPHAGKSYLLWRDADKLMVTHDDGTEVSADELKAVKKGNKSVGRPDVLEQFIAARAWKMGEAVAMADADIARMNEVMGDDAEASLKAMSLTVKAADDAVVTFSYTMAFTTTDPRGQMTMGLNGTARINRATGQPLENIGDGPFEGNMGFPITGTMSTRTVYTY